jgi:hypothetical protein
VKLFLAANIVIFFLFSVSFSKSTKSSKLSAPHRMVKTERDQTTINTFDVNQNYNQRDDENSCQLNTVIEPAIIPTSPNSLVPFKPIYNQAFSGDALGHPSFSPPAYNNNEGADFETAIELTGYGRFHYILLAICGLVSTSEEMDVISMSFILPSAECDLDLNTRTKGWLNCIVSEINSIKEFNFSFVILDFRWNDVWRIFLGIFR